MHDLSPAVALATMNSSSLNMTNSDSNNSSVNINVQSTANTSNYQSPKASVNPVAVAVSLDTITTAPSMNHPKSIEIRDGTGDDTGDDTDGAIVGATSSSVAIASTQLSTSPSIATTPRMSNIKSISTAHQMPHRLTKD